MASTDPKSSLLGSIPRWNNSQNTSLKPDSDEGGTLKDKDKDRDRLVQSSGRDHTQSMRPLPSPRRYPSDCPPLKTRWFYAVDVAKRKPNTTDEQSNDNGKAQTVPKKFTAFSASDSMSIEAAFQKLADPENHDSPSRQESTPRETRVPVNEDYLFDVIIQRRELEPAYWLGPVYEVRRGSWFYPEGTKLRPCEENLANQIEEGYLKVAPWRLDSRTSTASVHETRRGVTPPGDRSVKRTPPGSGRTSPVTTESTKQLTEEPKKSEQEKNTYRLFGNHMNTIVTYQDTSTAWLTTDDFMSRMSSTLAGYRRAGAFSGTKVVRGYSQTGGSKTSEIAKAPDGAPNHASGSSVKAPQTKDGTDNDEKEGQTTLASPRTALERQLSSLAGAPDNGSSDEVAEEARQQEEQEMEDYKEHEGDDQSRRIDHLVLVTHGIGQRLGLRIESINFVHDVNTLRKTMKAVYTNSPDLQALNSAYKDSNTNSRVLCLPIVWRHLLDFPKQNVRANKTKSHLDDTNSMDEDEYPSLSDITVDGVPAVRNLITDLAMDVLLYQSAYRRHIATIVRKECNRVYQLFKKRNPDFNGRVSLCGHSLGSAVLFDILSRQTDPQSVMSQTSNDADKDSSEKDDNLQLDFACENFFALGSPIALFQMLKGRSIAARPKSQHSVPAQSPLDPDSLEATKPEEQQGPQNCHTLPDDVSSPKCDRFFNVFHPTDPIAYRVEPLISPAMAALKPQLLPYTKRGLFGAPGIVSIGARVGQSVGSMWSNFTSGVASSLLNRSLGITGEDQALPQSNRVQGNMDKKNQQQLASGAHVPIANSKRQQALAEATLSNSTDSHEDHLPTLIDSEIETLYAGFQKRRLSEHSSSSDSPKDSKEHDKAAEEKAKKLKREEAKVRALNENGRIDYSIQEGTFDISLLASIASHLSYWADEDVNHFMMGQMLSKTLHEKKTPPS